MILEGCWIMLQGEECQHSHGSQAAVFMIVAAVPLKPIATMT